jgi:replicative DNA helicase
MIAMAVHAASLGYNVLYYTLELSEDYVGKRFDACLTGIPFIEVSSKKDKVASALEKLPGEIIVAEFPPGKASISTIEGHIEKVKEQHFSPDIIFIDYVDLLSTNKRTSDRKGEIDDIYTSTKGLAKHYKSQYGVYLKLIAKVQKMILLREIKQQDLMIKL